MGKGRMWLACLIVGIVIFFLGFFSTPKIVSVMCLGGGVFFAAFALYLGLRHAHEIWILLSWLLFGLGIIGFFLYLLIGK